jgi:class 3 adenylate cyclase
MNCPRCRHENESGAKFCEACAAPLLRTCTHCWHALSPAAKFCPECAQPAGPASTPIEQSHFGSPNTYTPKHLVERILASKAALEGERKQVTVLFADLKGSMELLADRDPEEARKILDPVLEHMMEAVHRYEGTVNQVMGDGIMALFGAPLAHEDHAVRACYAALRMQEAVRRYAEGVRRMTGVPVQIRVGLNSGEVVVRSIGSDLHMDYTAVGQTTHLAARMEQMAVPGTILLTPGALALAEGYGAAWRLGAYEAAEDRLQRALALADGPACEATIAHATCFVGMCAHALGDYPRAIEVLQRVRPPRGNDVFAVQQASVDTAWLAWALSDIGDFAEASRVAAEGLQGADHTHQPGIQAAASWAVGRVGIAQGEFARAVPVLERGLEIARSMQVLIWAPALAGSLGVAYARVGRLYEALPLVQGAARHWSTPAMVAGRAFSLLALGGVHLLAGRGDDALAAAREGLAGAMERKERGNEAAARLLLGDITAQTDPGAPAGAEMHYHQALALATELGMRPLVAHCHAGLARLYGRSARLADAEEHRQVATRMYREMGMTHFLDRLQADATSSWLAV